MSALTLFSVTDPQTPVWHSTDAKAIQDQLNAKGVRFERWQADRDLGANPSPETVIAAYQHAIDKLVAEKGYQSWDVISLRADNPQKEALREKFLNEHTHGEDEVRFFVEGAGLFCLHIGDEVFQVLCEKNDLISVPAHTPHWFDMGSEPNFTAIRIFDNPEGWIAQFTGDDIASVCAVHHPVQGDAGFAFAIDQHPVQRRAAAIFWQQRTVQVERPFRRQIEDLIAQQVAIVEGEQHVRLHLADTLNPQRMVHVFRRPHRNALLGGKARHGAKEMVFARVIRVGENSSDIIPGVQQSLDTGAAHIVISEDYGFHERSSSLDAVSGWRTTR
jgi:1,2-dihydroxy-3-keto-5-methylthiopentene dioxygenase